MLLLALLDDVAALEDFGWQVDEVCFLDLILVEEDVAEVLNLDLAPVVEENILHPQHALEAILQALDLRLERAGGRSDFGVPVEVLDPLEDLEADFDQKVLAQHSLLGLSRAEQVE